MHALPAPRRQLQYRTVFRSAITGLTTGVGYAVLQNLLSGHDARQRVLNGLVAGFCIGASVGVGEAFFFPARFRRLPFFRLWLARNLLYTSTSAFWLLAVVVASRMYFQGLAPAAAFRGYLTAGHFQVDFIFAVFFSFLFVAVQQITTLHGPGQLFKFVNGTYHQPREVDRIFMFVDMKSSTTIAETLGNLTYSRFIQDFFYDLTDAILVTKAEVYQYVGDEIVLAWPLAVGLDNANCVRCFYLMQDAIAARRDAYCEQYGYFPTFKAGLHGGNVVVTWVGEVKKEIVYHGDVLNTTARIQALCNELHQDLLISETLLNQLGPIPYVSATRLTTLLLRGKKQEVTLYGLNRVEQEEVVEQE
ncbi:adenylate/guanylate cyclase domain-containing protein [Hymenobacter terricola]|uniref:adenylate/guanylate cyclase domain-containing protein n=1 Tax=Hymenobacter terricola TaxID=2819236 RepID=UPI001B311196|nr:adenylate/guanylate cyclase domain-containing protein [Hymenobacter terricola]